MNREAEGRTTKAVGRAVQWRHCVPTRRQAWRGPGVSSCSRRQQPHRGSWSPAVARRRRLPCVMQRAVAQRRADAARQQRERRGTVRGVARGDPQRDEPVARVPVPVRGRARMPRSPRARASRARTCSSAAGRPRSCSTRCSPSPTRGAGCSRRCRRSRSRRAGRDSCSGRCTKCRCVPTCRWTSTRWPAMCPRPG